MYFQPYLHLGSCTEASHFDRMDHIWYVYGAVICKTHLLTPGNGVSLSLDVRCTFMYHDAPSVVKSDLAPFHSTDTHMSWNCDCDAPFHKMTHIIFYSCIDWTDLWRTMVHWLTMTHIRVNFVTDLLLPWWYYVTSIWGNMMHPWRTFPGGQ